MEERLWNSKKFSSSLFKAILGQKLRKRWDYGMSKLNDLHIDHPPGLVISNPAKNTLTWRQKGFPNSYHADLE